MNNENVIFNKKLLGRRLANYKLSDITEFEKKVNIISQWQYTLENKLAKRTKETSMQGDFLTDFFTNILGYKKRYGSDKWNINQEQRTLKDGKSADGALGFFTNGSEDIKCVIELKDALTDLDKKQKSRQQTPVEQGFSYAQKSGKNCNWIIISNFIEIRLYHHSDETKYERFLLSTLSEHDEFKRFYYLLNKQNLISEDSNSNSLINDFYNKNEQEQIKISENFYKEYKTTRIELFKHLKDNNPLVDEVLLLEKAQKLMDRFTFVCFAEDRVLIPEKVFKNVISIARQSFIPSNTKIWSQVKGLFDSIDKGNPQMNINKFNGGLFKKDEILDNLVITDEIFIFLEKISDYDFATELDVNILGHIFEQSISDIEEFKLELEGKLIDKNKGKRKKDGIYYTPTYITKYIVGKTLGSWLDERKQELGEDKLTPIPDFNELMTRSERTSRTKIINSHIEFLKAYRETLLGVKILDPACGSGAFLNQAFDYLRHEGIKVNTMLSKLESGQISFLDLDKDILKSNLYGVDINKESVEITKLSLWLKTANKQEELTSLDDNIKYGNSLVDDITLQNETPFNWQEEFKDILASGGFDIIIGNPPYVRQELINSYKPYLKTNYKTYSGRSDLYVYFFEKSICLLNKKGKMSFIVSSKYTKAKYGEPLREYILDNCVLEEFIDFGDTEVFKGITAYPSIIRLKKQQSKVIRSRNQVLYSNLENKKFNNISNIIQENQVILKQSRLNSGEWIFKSEEYLDLIKKLQSKNPTLKSKLGQPRVGFKTGLNKAYILTKEEANKLIMSNEKSKEIIYPILFGENIKPYKIIPNYFTIFPYIETNDGLKLVNISEYPSVKRHLESFRGDLEKRAIIKEGLSKGTKMWFEYQQINKTFSLKKKYIVYPNVAGQNSFAVSEGNILDMTAFYIECDEINITSYITLLNSQFVEKFIRNLAIERRGGFREYKTQYLNQVPLYIFNGNQRQMLHHFYIRVNDFQLESETYRKSVNEFLMSEYKLKISYNFDISNLSWQEFINFLMKQSTTELTVSEKEKLHQWFVEKHRTLNQIRYNLGELKNSINELVYSFYKLNVEEIKYL
ncbi:Eco57I restriction-modification methylase domain-containing protein [Peribacillus sp. NPDC076916]|uniref:Eco57I restriction-modification methylase domain-containing protein n=1 Tax=Peribacillus sp. NPDC076916 TaxID=3390608 RepID=UPI003D018F06